METGDRRWLQRRLSRRVLLGAAASGSGVVALSLIGCSGDDPTTTATPATTTPTATATPSSTATATPTATASASPAPTATVTASPTTTATPTGTPTPTETPSPTPTPTGTPAPIRRVTFTAFSGDPPGLDPHLQTGSQVLQTASFLYSRLMKFRTDPADPMAAFAFDPEGDVAESIEAPDLQTWTIKLRPGVKWHNREPANGRDLTAEDVKWNFERIIREGVNRDRFAALVDKVEAPDATTVTVQLKQPYAGFPALLASPEGLWLVNREVVESDGDSSVNPLGTGPFVATEFKSGEGLFATKNPAYFLPGLPLVDELDAKLAVNAGEAYRQFRQEANDVLRTTELRAEAELVKPDNGVVFRVVPQVGARWFIFDPASYSWAANKPPFNDQRVRQAVSMAINRAEMLTNLHGGKGLAAAGYFPTAFGPWYIDPATPAFGDPAKYLAFDVAGAKQLMEAAGLGSGIDVPIHYTSAYGPDFVTHFEAAIAHLGEIGINAKAVAEKFEQFVSTTYLGSFDGMAFMPSPVYTDIDAMLDGGFGVGSQLNHSRLNDSTLNERIAAQRQIADPASRVAAIQDIMRYSVEQAYYASTVMGQAFYLNHPWVKDWAVNATYATGVESFLRVATDKTV